MPEKEESMGYIRGLFGFIALGLILIIELPVHFVTWLIGKFDEKKCLSIRYAYVRVSATIIWAVAGGSLTVKGLENVPKGRPVLFVSNHRSIFDILILIKVLKEPVGFIAKKELGKTPLYLIMKGFRCLFLDREDPREGLKTVLTAIGYMKQGQSMAIFPEGTRNKTEGTMLPFHAGSFKIATKAQCPVVPVTIVGSGDILEDHFPVLKYVPVVIEFGVPVETAGMDRGAIRLLPDSTRDEILRTYEKYAPVLKEEPDKEQPEGPEVKPAVEPEEVKPEGLREGPAAEQKEAPKEKQPEEKQE